ncbi:hypothetical protein POX_b03389 [Penicillium oxalicum]|uniref:Uncharacterized protein n=1 Tax=Penicillium oxalicum (strain 114-2 / CGMCC 5302) TaxID=933388 RepID=S7ZLL7_PENO1|nr:hypothetical protein POX_b03389 [Penicillium oxalicum]EPS29586.1 hypothetical protein PDE_04536 [Penicillium oxalicum 114-2]KAI2793335.1 hypothetical protein POX_b03389 [Penicillium oxalicum]
MFSAEKLPTLFQAIQVPENWLPKAPPHAEAMAESDIMHGTPTTPWQDILSATPRPRPRKIRIGHTIGSALNRMSFSPVELVDQNRKSIGPSGTALAVEV